jgi:ABC-type multidrug transport system permease subunit
VPKPVKDAALIARVYLLMMQREWYIYVLLMALFPLAILVFARYLTPEGIQPSQRLIAGSIVFGLGISTVNGMTQMITNDRFMFRQKLFVAAPVHHLSYAAGLVFFGSIQGITNAAIILLFAPLFGITVHLSLWLVPIGLLTALSLTGVALVLGTWAPSAQSGNLLANTVGILVVMLSPIYYPLSRLPEWLQIPARLSPYTYAGEALDRVLSGTGGFHGEIAVLAAITVAGMVIGIAGMRWREV